MVDWQKWLKEFKDRPKYEDDVDIGPVYSESAPIPPEVWDNIPATKEGK